MYFAFFIQSLTDDVTRQTEREKELQKRFAELQIQKEHLLNALYSSN